MAKELIFVVHEHHARQLHYDLRLELDGVLKSWAVPKGPSLTPGVKRLAIAAPDHSYSYKDFEGFLPEGSYGAGEVKIWDKGTYTASDPSDGTLQNQLEAGKMTVIFNGKQLRGAYTLIRTATHENWLLIKSHEAIGPDGVTVYTTPIKHIEIVQGVVYRHGSNGLEFLVMKRVPEDGGFWQPVTGTIEPGEELLATLKRELSEEAGLTDLMHVSKMLHTYEWGTGTLSGRDSVFAVEVAPNTEVVLEPSEHDDCKWLPLEEAVAMLKYDGNRLSMRRAAEYALALT